MKDPGVAVAQAARDLDVHENDFVKIIWHDGQAANLFVRRLERGRFLRTSPADGVIAISSAQMGYLLSGIDRRNPVEAWRPTSVG